MGNCNFWMVKILGLCMSLECWWLIWIWVCVVLVKGVILVNVCWVSWMIRFYFGEWIFGEIIIWLVVVISWYGNCCDYGFGWCFYMVVELRLWDFLCELLYYEIINWGVCVLFVLWCVLLVLCYRFMFVRLVLSCYCFVLSSWFCYDVVSDEFCKCGMWCVILVVDVIRFIIEYSEISNVVWWV